MDGRGMGGMGGMGGYSQARPGSDEQIEVQVSFEEAVFGTKKDVDVNRLAECDACDGTGAKPGTKTTTCSECNGSGRVVSVMQTPLGTFQQMQVRLPLCCCQQTCACEC